MTSRAAIVFYRTTAGSDELELPQLGLSLPQRKMLRSCTQKIHLLELEQLFSGETAHYGRQRFLQDLDRMVELGLLYSNAGPLAPAAIKVAPAKPAASAPVVYADAGIKPAASRRPRSGALRPKVVGGFFAGIMVAAGGMIWANRAEPPRIGQHAANDQQIFADSTSDVPDSNMQAWANYIRQSDEPRANVKTGKINNTEREAEKRARLEAESRDAKARESKAVHAADVRPLPAAPAAAPATPRANPPLAANDVITDNTAPRPAPTQIAPASTAPVVAPPPASTAAPVLTAAPVAAPAPAPVIVASIAPTPLPSAARAGEPATDSSNEKKSLKLLHRETPDFPPEALLSDVRRGKVKAKLTLDEAGNVADIQIVESKPNRLFVRPAIWSLKKWRYEGTGKTETAMVDLEFRE